MKKERLILLFFIIIVLIEKSYCLGVSPAKISLDFQPGLEREFLYRVTGISETKKIKVSAHGDLSEYVSIDKKSFTGPNFFYVKLKLPKEIEIPGPHRIWIKVEEDTEDEELVGSGIGTSVTINVAIDIFVPYPGKYIEITEFNAKNVNKGENVTFSFNLINRGKETVSFEPEIKIRDVKNNFIEKLNFNRRTLEPTQSISLKKDFATSEISPGKYNATLLVEYGGSSSAKKEIEFRVGTLTIYLKNYPSKIEIGGLKRFDLEIENGWNDEIYGAYADVVITNESGVIYGFKTSTTPLAPWEIKNITGYIETDKISKGLYDAKITFFYYGKEVGSSNTENVKIEFVKKEPFNKLILIIAILIILIVALIISIIILGKRIKNGKKR